MNLTGHLDRPVDALHRDPPTPVARLDLAGLALAGQLVPGAMDGTLAQEIRLIKQPLLRRMRDDRAGPARLALVMVTSALHGEGRTTLAINLAMSLAAEIDRTVLLVDVDTVAGGAMRRLGLRDEPGLMDLLANPALSLGEVVRRTDVPRLSVLPAGRRHRMAAELLASRSMERLLERMLGESGDQVVVFDAPPLLPGSEAKVLASQVGQVVVVVDAWRSPARAVARAFASLAGCAEVSAVLNRAHPETQAFGADAAVCRAG